MDSKEFQIQLGTVIVLAPNLAEVIVAEDLEVETGMVEEYHECLLENLVPPFGVLFNQKNRHSYTFEAQMAIGTIQQLGPVAVLAYDDATEHSMRAVLGLPGKQHLSNQFFYDRDAALDWLKEELYRPNP